MCLLFPFSYFHMLDISTIRLGKVLKVNEQPYLVVYALHFRTAQRRANLKTKLKNLVDGSVLEKTFTSGEKADEADLERGHASFLYIEGNEANFMNSESFEQFSLSKENVGEGISFLKDGTEVSVLNFEGHPVAVQLPAKIELKVTSAPPGIKGDTAGTATKTVTVETGYQVNAPLFIKEGDVIRINTETGEYVERVAS